MEKAGEGRAPRSPLQPLPGVGARPRHRTLTAQPLHPPRVRAEEALRRLPVPHAASGACVPRTPPAVLSASALPRTPRVFPGHLFPESPGEHLCRPEAQVDRPRGRQPSRARGDTPGGDHTPYRRHHPPGAILAPRHRPAVLQYRRPPPQGSRTRVATGDAPEERRPCQLISVL